MTTLVKQSMIRKITLFYILFFFAFTMSASTTTKYDPIKSPKKSQLSAKVNQSNTISGLNTFTERNVRNLINTFDESYIKQHFVTDTVTNEKILQAKAVMDDLETSQNFIDLVSPDDLITLPVGIKKKIGNVTYTLGISKARFTPEYTEITAFVKITIQQTDAQGRQKQLFFGANNIKLSHKGGIYGEANLVLLGDMPIPIQGGNTMVVLKGGLDMKTGDIKNQTYVTIDCSGFKELGITADVLFSRKMLEPVDATYRVKPELKTGDKDYLSSLVTGHFKTIVSDWSDILVEITLPPFQLTKDKSTDGTGKAGLIFELNTAVFDFSDIRNSPEVKFPTEYQKFLIPGNEQLWRGIYVKTLKVVLPEQFKKRASKERVVFQATDLLIDGLGVSGKFSVDHILPITEGDASKWQFSVDHIEATFVTNNLTGAGFNGSIVLPVSSEVTKEEAQAKDATAAKQKALVYSAIIDPTNDEYLLKVSSKNPISFNVFQATATLTPDSYIELRVKDKKFRPRAVLHGSLAIQASNATTTTTGATTATATTPPANATAAEDSTKKTVDFKGVTFQNLQLQTESPYFKVDYLGYAGEVKFANFPVTISEIGLTANDTEASLHFAIDVNMMSGGFAGGTSLSVIASFKEDQGLNRWKYDRIKINRISIEADLGAIKMKGFVDIKDNDPVYGNGFYGKLDADFNSVKVSASAWFGKTDFRYWYVDAYVDLSNSPVKVYIGPAIVNGFGGGAYYKMTKKPNEYSAGIPSGLSYIPDVNSGLGFRALIGFALANEKAFNGKVGFEMAFNTHGGLNRVSFFGEGHIVKALDFKFGDKFKEKLTKMENKINDFGDKNLPMDKLKESNLVEYSKVAFPQDGLSFDVGIDANFSMEMDFQNHVFHSEMEIFINTPGGFFQGVGPKGRAGWAVFHAGRDEWYLHAGTPTDRVGLKLGLGSFKLEATSYLMIGDNIPGSPPPPAIVAEILGVDMQTLDYMRDLNALGDGRGFAFGMNLSLDTGDMSFLVFYARFQAGLGFDIMIKDYGEAACEGTGPIGIDGWYANGQAYVYLQGELGINVKLLFVRKKIPIIKAGAAVLMQAKLPNPSWFRGYMGGYFDLLGGMVKGRFRFKIELGKECELIGGAPLGGMKIISDINPKEGTTGVDVFTVPQVVFNTRINTPFELEDDKGTKTYRILLDKYTVTTNGKPIEGTIVWNESKDAANFISTDILPPNSPIAVSVAVSFQEMKGQSWVTLTQDGQVAKEVKDIIFTTGEAPDYIPISNIEYSYPIVDQQYFYQSERNSGYLKLKRGQPYLFPPVSNWTQQINFESDAGTVKASGLAYDQAQRQLQFNFAKMTNSKKYTIRIISTPPAQASNTTVKEVKYTATSTGQEGNSIEVKNREAESVSKDATTVDVLVYNFSTSAYNTFADKVQDKKVTNNYLEPIYSDVHAIQTDVKVTERFGLTELIGGPTTNYAPMINVEAVLDDNYFTNSIYPLIYQGYPLQPQFTVNRNTDLLGIVPKKGIDVLTWYSSYLDNNPTFPLLDVRMPYRYNLPLYYKQDFMDIQYKIVNTYLNKSSQYQTEIQKYNYIINGVFPSIKRGDYKIKMQYTLPGNIKGSSAIFTYTNPF
ncbi:hypothetical protein [Flavobacterium muglaense]|uniref:Uncharacterized protein n=1 Tax=Flavobacterium muglaense TaxID=2764716 RepID=A0A923MZM8_9FLAO|nr:hypothetical protein [Flavobacterium muglaense]MBC5837503.1 hypothetical protein [Flavobacterium muglaense]MBC5844080.1 hypothetical protein [Flavobacterium muglaense]